MDQGFQAAVALLYVSREVGTASALQPQPIPLVRDAAGRLVIVGTRMPLETLMAAFKRGESPATIHESYDTAQLAGVYAVLAYRLRHMAEVESYLAERERQDSATRAWIEAGYPAGGLRAKPLARLGT